MATLNVVLWDLTLVDLLLFGEEVNRELLLVGVTGFEPMASWSRSKPIWCIFEFLGQKPLYIVAALDTNGIKK